VSSLSPWVALMQSAAELASLANSEQGRGVIARLLAQHVDPATIAAAIAGLKDAPPPAAAEQKGATDGIHT
jgi:hypothetical protein